MRPSEQVLREIEMAIASVLSKKPKLARTDLVQAVEKMAPVLGTFHGCEIEKDSCAMLIRRLEARLTVTLDLGSSVCVGIQAVAVCCEGGYPTVLLGPLP